MARSGSGIIQGLHRSALTLAKPHGSGSVLQGSDGSTLRPTTSSLPASIIQGPGLVSPILQPESADTSHRHRSRSSPFLLQQGFQSPASAPDLQPSALSSVRSSSALSLIFTWCSSIRRQLSGPRIFSPPQRRQRNGQRPKVGLITCETRLAASAQQLSFLEPK